MVTRPPWSIERGAGPVIAVAVHHGHELRPEVAQHTGLSSQERMREEDPFTGEWTEAAPTRAIVWRSRFECDLNRPLEKAVYRTPADAWQLNVWSDPLPERAIAASLAMHRRFYEEMAELLDEYVREYGAIVVLDLHSYNHRRNGPDAPPAPSQDNPDINLGTGTLDRTYWAPLIDDVLAQLQTATVRGATIDVRENVRFRGGYFSQWVNATYGPQACSLAIEFKKFFMDEWSGGSDRECIEEISEVLRKLVVHLEVQHDREHCLPPPRPMR